MKPGDAVHYTGIFGFMSLFDQVRQPDVVDLADLVDNLYAGELGICLAVDRGTILIMTPRGKSGWTTPDKCTL